MRNICLWLMYMLVGVGLWSASASAMDDDGHGHTPDCEAQPGGGTCDTPDDDPAPWDQECYSCSTWRPECSVTWEQVCWSQPEQLNQNPLFSWQCSTYSNWQDWCANPRPADDTEFANPTWPDYNCPGDHGICYPVLCWREPTERGFRLVCDDE